MEHVIGLKCVICGKEYRAADFHKRTGTGELLDQHGARFRTVTLPQSALLGSEVESPIHHDHVPRIGTVLTGQDVLDQ